MDLSLLPTLAELVKANLFLTGLTAVVYGVLLAWIIRETRLSHQALAQVAASNERIAQMVRDLHRPGGR